MTVRLDRENLPTPALDARRREEILAATLADTSPPTRGRIRPWVAVVATAATVAAVAGIGAFVAGRPTSAEHPPTTVPPASVPAHLPTGFSSRDVAPYVVTRNGVDIGPIKLTPMPEPQITMPTVQIRTDDQLETLLPLAPYLGSLQDEIDHFRAAEMLKKQCAARYGVDYLPQGGGQPSELQQGFENRYGIMADGGRTANDVDTTPYFGDHPWNPDARELLVMNADASGTIITDPVTGKKLPKYGCASYGFRALRGSTGHQQNYLAEGLLVEAYKRFRKDSRFLAAQATWSRCMATKGFPKIHEYEGHGIGRTKKPALDCALTTHFFDVAYAVDYAYETKLIAQHEDALEESMADHRELMKRVREVLRDQS